MRQPPVASKPEPHHEHWYDVAGSNRKAEVDEKSGRLPITETKPNRVFNLHRHTTITDYAGVIEDVEAKGIGVDVVVLSASMAAPELKPVLHRPIRHAVSARRSHIKLVPTSQCRRITQRKPFE